MNDSPFVFLPDPAREAGLEMMYASSDGMIEPDIESKRKYISRIHESYSKL